MLGGLQQLIEEGIIFKTNCEVGENVSIKDLRKDFDALLLTGGACESRELIVDGRDLNGIYQAMEYLPMQNKLCEGDKMDNNFISAKGKHVVIIGGGDTGADCLGTANRQGAKSVHQLEILPKPPNLRSEDNPWPEWPRIFRTASAHEEGVERVYSVSTKKFVDDGKGNVMALQVSKVEMKNLNGQTVFEEIKDSMQELPCDLVLLAMGFLGPEKKGMLEEFGINRDNRGNVVTDKKTWMTNIEGVFSAGDMRRGQSLIVWAIAEGRSAASGIDKYLMGETDLPALV